MVTTVALLLGSVVSADAGFSAKASIPYASARRFAELSGQPILVVLHRGGQRDSAIRQLRKTMDKADVVMVVGEADTARLQHVWAAVGRPCTPAVTHMYWRDGQLRFNSGLRPPVVAGINAEQLKLWLAGRIERLEKASRAPLGYCPSRGSPVRR